MSTKRQILAGILTSVVITTAALFSCNKEHNGLSDQVSQNAAPGNTRKELSLLPVLATKCITVTPDNKTTTCTNGTTVKSDNPKFTINATVSHPNDVWSIWFIFGNTSNTPVSIPKVGPFTYQLTFYKRTGSNTCKVSYPTTSLYNMLFNAGIIKWGIGGDYVDCSANNPFYWNYAASTTYPGPIPPSSPVIKLNCCDGYTGGASN